MYVVAGATGNTGSVVLEKLVAAKKQVRVLVRDEKKAVALRARGAEVVAASVDDPAALAAAIRGAEGLYTLLPPDVTDPDPFGRTGRFTDALVRALDGSGVRHVAFLSSIGAQHPTGTGPIRTLHNAEKKLRAQRVPVTFIRAASFIENWGSGLAPAAKDGVLPTFERPETVFAQVATHDIGLVAAEALLDPAAAHRTIELAGPVDLSPADIARTLSTILGRDVSPHYIPQDQVVPTFTSFGVSEATAELFREMAKGVDDRHVAWEGPAANVVRGKTTAETVLRGLLARSAA
ncbi:MAG: NmrA family NAD(P)-binding protein [Polyangiaceae bacterium]|nr:NmrA family NAD(P)-binding protein [Polyangiaceae bacterium]